MNKLPTALSKLGQHYLNDQNLIKKITTAFSSECDLIVEVGPGPAILTEGLAEHNLPTYVIETDSRFEEYLEKYIPQKNIYMQDALRFDWEEFIKIHASNKKIWLVSNLPYNISVPLFRSFLPHPQIKNMTLMYQKEVGEKMLELPHKKNQMNSLLALSQNYFEVSLLAKVPPGAFLPPPKVESIVINYKRIEEPHIPLSELVSYEDFLRKLFHYKRKQLGTIFKEKFPKLEHDKFWSNVELDHRRRSETLGLHQVQKLYNSSKERN